MSRNSNAPALHPEELAQLVGDVVEGDPEVFRAFLAALGGWPASVLLGALLARGVLELGVDNVRSRVDEVIEQLRRAAATRNLERTDGEA